MPSSLLNPSNPAFMVDPYPFYARLRQTCPIFFEKESNLWFFTTYEDIAALLTDKRLGRSLLPPWSHAMVRMDGWNHREEDERKAERATIQFVEYLEVLIEKRRSEPRDDLISALSKTEEEGRLLSRDELISTGMFLLNAGHEATVNASGNGMLALLRNPRELNRLRKDPSLVKSACPFIY